LQRDLPRIDSPVRLIHGAKDAAVPTRSVEQAAKLMPRAQLSVLAGLGHLAHEERADLVAEAISAAASVQA
jgi:magnesium chelatase accessory protein